MRKNRPRWFGLVMRRDEMKAVRVVMRTNVEEKKGEEDRKKRWLDTIENDLRTAGVRLGSVER